MNDLKDKKLNAEEIKEVNGGNKVNGTPGEDDQRIGYFHKDCGGRIDGIGDPFSNCKCRVCGEEKYWSSDIPYYEIWESGNTYYKYYENGGHGYKVSYEGRPPEFDLAENK